MKVTLGSMFRDSTGYLDRYFAQVGNLRDHGYDVRLALAEGDSVDGTYEALEGFLRSDDLLVKVDHGGRRWGSIDIQDRWDDIAVVMRGLLDALGDRRGDAFVWVESDLIWNVEAMEALLSDLATVDAVAPMVYADDSARFYDVWGYRRAGARFKPFPPYWQGQPEKAPLLKIDSCGSCFALAPAAFGDLWHWSGHWPFTAGGSLWLDTEAEVRHP